MRKRLRQSRTVQGGALVGLGTAAAAIVPLLPPQYRVAASTVVAVAAPLVKGIGALLGAIGIRRAIAKNGSGQ